jgi:hypothetical protein
MLACAVLGADGAFFRQRKYNFMQSLDGSVGIRPGKK